MPRKTTLSEDNITLREQHIHKSSQCTKRTQTCRRCFTFTNSTKWQQQITCAVHL